MARYDWGWERGSTGRRPQGYGSDYRGWAGRGGMGRAWGVRGGGYDQGYHTGGYRTGAYGRDYPEYGGYPGGAQRGMYYGGPGYAGPGRPMERGGSGPGGAGRGYDQGWAREPFMPQEAYRRHPEFDRAPHHEVEWGSGAEEAAEMGDDEIRQAVRESLYNDGWVSADRIDVKVEDGVVTLTGEVADYMEVRYAWDDAWESPGVRGVVTQLAVRTDQPGAQHGDPVPQSSGGSRGRRGK